MVRKGPFSTYPNLMCIWYQDENIMNDVLRQMNIALHQNFSYSRIFDTEYKLCEYLARKPVIKHIVFIISTAGKKATAIDKMVKRRPQYRKSYELPLKHYQSSPLPSLASIGDMITNAFSTIIEDLKNTIQPIVNSDTEIDDTENVKDESTIEFGTFQSISAERSFCNLDKESKKFLLFQSLIEVLVRIPYERKDFDHMWNLCCADNTLHSKDVDKIEKIKIEYESRRAIYHYTQACCLFRLINRAFRLEDVERIYRFGCLIADLHNHLKELSDQQNLNGSQHPRTFYRGKRFSTHILQQFKDNVGHLVSMNGLFSTTKNYNVSTMFSGMGTVLDDCHSVIFEINIDSSMTHLIRPYANISECSAIIDEEEVLFFMGFVWRIESMEKMGVRNWYIVLQSCTEYDPAIIRCIEDSNRECSYLTIGNILRELGDYPNAKNFYRRMLNGEAVSNEIRRNVYFNMGMVNDDEGTYLDALHYFQEAEKFITPITTHNNEQPSPPRPLFMHKNVASHLHILNNKGRCYLRDGDYRSAAENFDAALQQPGSDVERATVLNNYGLLEYYRRNLALARDYLEQAVGLAQNDECVSEFKRNLHTIMNRIAANIQ